MTLRELASVVAITAIVAAAAAPSFTALIDARRLDSAATRLAPDVQLARSEAIAPNRRFLSASSRPRERPAGSSIAAQLGLPLRRRRAGVRAGARLVKGSPSPAASG